LWSAALGQATLRPRPSANKLSTPLSKRDQADRCPARKDGAMPDRLRSIIDVLVDIDDPAAGAELARRAHLSRFHFDRVTAAVLGESPGVFRRRLLLERAAYGLTRGTSVTTRRSAPVTRR